MTISGHFSANYINSFHKTEVLTVILKGPTCQNLNWVKSYDINQKMLLFPFIFSFVRKNPGNLQLINVHFKTIFDRSFGNYIIIFHKNEIQTVILRCLVSKNCNRIKNYSIISVEIFFFHAWKCIISGLVCRSEVWHLLRKSALIFLNDYVQTPSIPDFKGFIMRNLQYEIKKLPKSCNKGTRTHSIWFDF